jgi:hypothetical protein
VVPPVAELLLAPAAPPLLPPVPGWVAPPDEPGWLLVLELQPTLTAAAYNNPKTTITSKRNLDLPISPVRIAFTLQKDIGRATGTAQHTGLYRAVLS